MKEVKYQTFIDEENKKKILSVLADGEKDWKTIKELTGFADSVLARHLKELEEAGLITTRIDKSDRRKKIYSLSSQGVENIMSLAYALFFFNHINYRFYEVLKKCAKDFTKKDEWFKEWFLNLGWEMTTAAKKNLLGPYFEGFYMFSKTRQSYLQKIKDHPIIAEIEKRKTDDLLREGIESLRHMVKRVKMEKRLIETGDLDRIRKEVGLKNYHEDLSKLSIERLQAEMGILEELKNLEGIGPIVRSIEKEVEKRLEEEYEEFKEEIKNTYKERLKEINNWPSIHWNNNSHSNLAAKEGCNQETLKRLIRKTDNWPNTDHKPL
ncbi:MAG: winged helix-turn-helix transcriptional regulator [Archaeoglobus sp.]|uniref:ArsR/SmtB family transcription factor n=1 Tax=Archaeoglobus sp. TaxID=1872626 RepID=UPI001DCDAEFA|nr:winged helix-turn-helix domain-containing protein [Archaeoglobus sp.]MBO8180665.1 winged helix-turn-helix transcriptional regulator [Archaeoglobus sp.]